MADKQELTIWLPLGGDTPGAVIVQEASAEGANGVMRVKVPFYRGNSLVRAQGFAKRIYMGKDILPAIVQEGNDTIKRGKPPLTVYARHADAISGRDLPIGGVAELEHDGSSGYGILEIVPTSKGRDAQMLMQSGHVNSVSLRSGKDWEMQPGKIDGESVLIAKRLPLAGIDLAPDDPAQDTYGMTILNENVKVEADTDDVPEGADHNRRNNLDPITLESVPADVREKIESPIRIELETAKKELETVRAEVTSLTQERAQRDLDTFIAETAVLFPKPEEARQVLQDLAKEKGCKTKEEFSSHVIPILLELRTAGTTTAPQPSATERLRGMFPTKPTGSGNTTEPAIITQEGGNGNGATGDQPVMLESKDHEFAGKLAIPQAE